MLFLFFSLIDVLILVWRHLGRLSATFVNSSLLGCLRYGIVVGFFPGLDVVGHVYQPEDVLVLYLVDLELFLLLFKVGLPFLHLVLQPLLLLLQIPQPLESLFFHLCLLELQLLDVILQLGDRIL